MTINELYKSRLNDCIVETYGISDTLHMEIIPRYLRVLKKAIKVAEIDSNNGIETKHGRFKFDFFNDGKYVLGTAWYVYYFNNDAEYEEFISLHPMSAGVSYDDKIAFINIYYVNGKPMTRNFYDSIGHELEHLFQEIQMGKGFGNLKVYDNAKKYLSSNNDYKRHLAEIIYASTKSEQEAFINGFYQSFINGEVYAGIDNGIEESECGQWLKKLYSGYSFLKKNKDNDELLKAINEYKQLKDYYTYKYFLYVARNGIIDLEKRISRLTIKLKDKFLNEHTFPMGKTLNIIEYFKIR